jgi:dephospho-CoA kinase
VAEAYRKWTLAHSDKPYTIKEAAITFETDNYKKMDKMILVTAPESVRIDRVTERDGIKTQQVRDRMAAQWPDDRKIPLSDFVIDNGGEKALIPQVLEIHRELSR